MLVTFNHDRASRIPWVAAERALARVRHSRTTLESLNSVGALKSAYCPMCAETGHFYVEYSYSNAPRFCWGRSGF